MQSAELVPTFFMLSGVFSIAAMGIAFLAYGGSIFEWFERKFRMSGSATAVTLLLILSFVCLIIGFILS